MFIDEEVLINRFALFRHALNSLAKIGKVMLWEIFEKVRLISGSHISELNIYATHLTRSVLGVGQECPPFKQFIVP